MVDYSDWLRKPRASRKLNVFGVVCLIVCFTALMVADFSLLHPEGRKDMLTVAGVVFLATLFAGTRHGTRPNPDYNPDSGTFAAHTEQVFGITGLKCEDGDAGYRLPADRTRASWIAGDRLVQGTILVDGTKVGLAGADGTLVKAAG